VELKFMPRIKQLPNSVITKIAAGEVIERPASVVKELLENSLDASSNRIDIDVEEGGAELIRVVDNGHGIHAEDLALAFSNHATSKLASADDLFCVRTMGFRGEALASIGGVGQVTLQSRAADEGTGAEIQCEGGVLSGPRPWNGGAGTRIEVRHLFFNTPVRRKFLRAPGTEIGHICEAFTRIALARPGLHLTLRHNGKQVYEVPASAGLLDRLGLFFGKEVRDKLYAVDARQADTHLFGFIADPSCDRGNGKLQYLFLNGRWIRDRSLLHALQEGYRGLLMTGRYAVAALFLELPPDQVDVNVHPTKAEVRFRDANALYRMMLVTIRDRLAKENLVARLQVPVSGPVFSFPTGGNGPALREPQTVPQTPSLFSQPGFPTFRKTPPPLAALPPTMPEQSSPLAPREDTENTHQATASPPEPEARRNGHASYHEQLASSPEGVRALQLHNAYLVLETPEGMLVIDQHALHERILFEQIKDRVAQGVLESQQLLVPEPVDLPAQQAALLLEQRDALATLGLGIEDFGGGTVLITRYPALLGKRSPAEILRRVVDHLAGRDRLPTREQLLSDLMSLMACHAAVRSGDALNADEIAALVALRHLAADAHHCPHGRPTALLFTRQDLDRQFRRI
jgi:DNA mismatch repair protein MutL